MNIDKGGRVFLVGAGPGDPALLTLKALDCIRKADLLVFDHLVNPCVLSYKRLDAEVIYAGKKAGEKALRQSEINELLVSEAKKGKVVVRLKGGDPFMFGRGGEEAEYLKIRGIPFEVVPGISSAMSCPAYAGIPVTHRKYSSIFTVVTGHEDPSKEKPDVPWSRLARLPGTLVILMGIRTLPHIIQNLLSKGRRGDESVAVIEWGTLGRQRVVVGRLDGIVEDVKTHKLKAPCVVVVGDVVRLRDHLMWFEKRPLFGKRVVVTRTRGEEGCDLRIGLIELGAEIFDFPTTKIGPPRDLSGLDQALKEISGYYLLVFTSQNGVKYFFKRLFERGGDARNLKGLKIAVIGPKTKEAVERFSIRVDFMPTDYRTEGLLSEARMWGLSGRKVLIPRTRGVRDLLSTGLKELGAEVCEVETYQILPDSGDLDGLKRMLSRGEIDLVTFTSSINVRNFCKILGEEIDLMTGVKVSCIGPVTASTCQEFGLRVDIVPEKYTIPDVLDAILSYFTRDSVR
jgi:uroporphyrinogen III methyltransferase/synthase